MDFLIGFVGKDYVMLAADTNAARSIMVINQDLDKIKVMDSHKLLAVGGDPADCIQEPDYFQKNLALHTLRTGMPLSTHAFANYMRGEKAYNLRRGMSAVDMLLGGWDEDAGPSLYFLDYLSSMQKLDKASHGYGGFFVNGLLDMHWKPGMTEAEGMDLMQMCFKEVQTRFMISMPKFSIKIVDRQGTRTVTPAS